MFESIAEALKGGDEVRLVGFGTFSVAARAASEGRNPRTGEKIKIAASKQPKFKPGKGLRDELVELTPGTDAGNRRRNGAVSRTGAISSAAEHLVYTERVGGSNPSSPTNEAPRRPARCP